MNEVNFTGDLKSKKPDKFIKEAENIPLDNFFLTLGLAYNDLKSLIVYLTHVQTFCKDISPNELTCKLGECNGMNNHLTRLIISTIHEFLLLLEKNSKITKDAVFEDICSRMNTEERLQWNHIIKIAEGDHLSKKGNDFKAILMRIRENGAFHYHSSLKLLRKGFIDHFYNKNKKSIFTERAYYSKGENVEDVRYFFCDAAIQGFNISFIQEKMDYGTFLKEFQDFTKIIIFLLKRLLKEYISYKGA